MKTLKIWFHIVDLSAYIFHPLIAYPKLTFDGDAQERALMTTL